MQNVLISARQTFMYPEILTFNVGLMTFRVRSRIQSYRWWKNRGKITFTFCENNSETIEKADVNYARPKRGKRTTFAELSAASPGNKLP